MVVYFHDDELHTGVGEDGDDDNDEERGGPPLGHFWLISLCCASLDSSRRWLGTKTLVSGGFVRGEGREVFVLPRNYRGVWDFISHRFGNVPY